MSNERRIAYLRDNLTLADGDFIKVNQAGEGKIPGGTPRKVTLTDLAAYVKGEAPIAANVGTAGTGVTAVETGSGAVHTTTLTAAAVALTIGDTAALADGALVYTFPAGVILVESAYISMGVTLTTGTPTTDTPDVGLGTVIATGAVATLDGTATFEDILTGQTAADIAGTATEAAAAQSLLIPAASAHTVHFNIADTWANVDDTAATADGTIILNWRKLS